MSTAPVRQLDDGSYVVHTGQIKASDTSPEVREVLDNLRTPKLRDQFAHVEHVIDWDAIIEAAEIAEAQEGHYELTFIVPFQVGTIVQQWTGSLWTSAQWEVMAVDGDMRWCRTYYRDGEPAYRTISRKMLKSHPCVSASSGVGSTVS